MAMQSTIARTIVRELTRLTNPKMHQAITHNAPFCNRNVCTLWDMGVVYCGICAIGLFPSVIPDLHIKHLNL